MNNKISTSVFKGIQSLILENHLLRLEWLPGYGGKLCSLQYKHSNGNIELLFQYQGDTLAIPKHGDTFSDYDSSGFDECFPTILPCEVMLDKQQSITMPDHGDVWAMPWQVIEADALNGIKLSVSNTLLGYTLTKVIKLTDNLIDSHYSVSLTGNIQRLPFIWTPHALFNIRPDLQLIMPKQMDTIINVMEGCARLGKANTIHPYPLLAENGSDMGRIPMGNNGTCEKYYFVETLRAGDQFGFQDEILSVLMQVTSDKIPYLGIWKNQGACKDSCNFAIEPCSGIYDSTQDAQQRQRCSYVENDQPFEWDFLIEVNSSQ
ncbi:hypothetical protein [Psychromonas sp.]|uniref:hypothetical protein n=1 Tax=Psychromonas sp. TaxID=1884585 RepID=UPI0039E2ECCB